MNTRFLSHLLIACLLGPVAAPSRADQEQDLIALLQSAAGVPEKCTACYQLSIVGTAKAVPALASLLGEERLTHAARHALEVMPCPEAGAALRQALGKSAGLVQAGLIDSLGWRGEPESVTLLAPLLSAADATIASAAAAALGRIGGNAAADALSAARDQAPEEVQPALLEGLLQCAESLRARNNNPGAVALYRKLYDNRWPPHIRAAAWRGLALSDTGQRVALITSALLGTDHPTHRAALNLVRELGDEQVIQACVRQWAALPADSQLAVLDAHLKRGAEALPTVRAASQSPHPAVRVAAWQALADLNEPSAIPALAKAAAHGQPEERNAARDTLARLHGPEVRPALLAQLDRAEPLEKAELLRVLGERGDRGATEVLLQNAGVQDEAVRLAALESLRTLALPDTITPLLNLAAQSKSEAARQPVLKALYAVCRASPDKEQISLRVVEAMNRFSVEGRRQVLPLLAELGTTDALAAVQAAARDQDPELVKEAVRVLAQWPNASPAPYLFELARAGTDPTLQTLALRGAITVAGLEPDPSKRLALLRQAITTARRPEEKKQALGQIGQTPVPEALEIALKELTNPDLVNEAGLAAVSLAEKLAGSDPKRADAVAAQILDHCQATDIVQRAWALRIRPKAGGPFIQDWLVCGPYSQAGAVGAEAVFNIAFGPEKPGEAVSWKSLPRTEHVNLAALFPGQVNCVAYLKAEVIAPADCSGALLLGSDDGVKAWLNGAVVHSNNIDRGEVPDQDLAPVQLKKGANELLLKITQGGGGWSASARLVGSDGSPIPGLRVTAQKEAAPRAEAAAPRPAAAPKAATLPPRDAFRTLRLSDQFYAEGAHYADFNRDGKMDVVAGPFWFEGPGFEKRHEYRPAKTFDPKNYSDNFLTFAGDFNGDGWADVFCAPFPGTEGYWYENPAGQEGHWKARLAYPMVGNESPVWGDLTGDGQPELVFCNEGYLGYAGPDPTQPDQPWIFHPVSTKDARYQRFTHGVGFGDINGDQRADVVEAAGWWEQPASAEPDRSWTFHPFRFADAGAQMLVQDVDGDGSADIITAWHCHLYGLVWWKQLRKPNAPPDWQQHVILSPTPDIATTDFRVSQLHALELVDMNGDGLPDILTGKRFWAHGPTGDKEPDAPAVVFWLELRRDGNGQATFVPHLIDDDSGVGTQVAATDLNGDGRPDVVVGNKKGIFLHLTTR